MKTEKIRTMPDAVAPDVGGGKCAAGWMTTALTNALMMAMVMATVLAPWHGAFADDPFAGAQSLIEEADSGVNMLVVAGLGMVLVIAAIGGFVTKGIKGALMAGGGVLGLAAIVALGNQFLTWVLAAGS